MTWLEVATKLGLIGVLAFLCHKLWEKFESKEKELADQTLQHKKDLAAKDAEYQKILEEKDQQIAELNERRIADLQAILKPRG